MANVTKPVLLDETGQAIEQAISDVASAIGSGGGGSSMDDVPTEGSPRAATSGGIYSVLQGKASVTVTTVDPGEGSPLADNTLLIVVEE